MLRKRFWIAPLGLLLLVLSVNVVAQDPQPQAKSETGVEITWPPPVTEVWGQGEVLGTANVPNQAYYYLEFIALNDDLSIPQGAPWLPATIAITTPVIDNSLATLDTTTVQDGLYAVRLVVNTVDGQQFTDVVMPVRVNNQRFANVINRIIEEVTAQLQPTEPTPEPTPEPTVEPVDNTPRVAPAPGLTAVNVRRCDLVDNDRCPVIGALQQDSAVAVALSANGTGWILVQLPNSGQGWVSPTVIAQTGDFSSLGYVVPAAPLNPPPVVPTAVPTGNVIANGIAIQGGTATCGQQFNVQVNVINTGNGAVIGGSITLQSVNLRTGVITGTNYGSYPSLNPGANYLIVIPMTVTTYFAEDHELRAYAPGGQVNLRYRLRRGDCGPEPTPTPAPADVRDFPPNQCFVVYGDGTPAYERVEGNIITNLAGGSRSANRGRVVGGVRWYRIEYPDLGQVWLVEPETQGNCRIRQ